jgi:multicomponent Na+:H+ antiporter subunit F
MDQEDFRMIDIGTLLLPELLVAAGSLVILVVICLIRLIIGPTSPDKLVALDTMNTIITAALVVLGLSFGAIIYIDVAIVYALLSFVSTLFISRYIEGKL